MTTVSFTGLIRTGSLAGDLSAAGLEPSGMTIHIPLPVDAIGRVYQGIHQELSGRRMRSNDWIPLGGGTGYLKYRLWPGSQELSVSHQEMHLRSSLPFGVEYAKRVSGSVTRLASCGLESPATGAGRLSVQLETRFSYLQGYQLQPSTNVAAVEPKGSCLLQDRAVDAAPLMSQVYRSELQQALPDADRKARQVVSLKKTVANVWRDLHEPLLLDEAAAIWLLVHPEAVGPGSIQPSASSLAAGFGITARPSVVRGARPAAALRPLPELTDAGTPEGFRVTFDAEVPLEEANERLREAVVGQEWSLGLGTVRIADAKLYAVGERAAVELILRGLVPFTVVLQGTPEYDESTGRIVFKQFDYRIKERNGVVNFAEAYLHDALRDLLGQHVTVPIREELDAMRRVVEKGLNKPLKGGTLRGTVDELLLKQLAFQPAGFTASFRIEGELHYDIAPGPAEP
jgi:hypothetical protein